MARIKIEDLPVKEDMSEKELKGVFGGAGLLLPAVQKVRARSQVPVVHTRNPVFVPIPYPAFPNQ